jgi:hypothetical protein
MRSGPWFRYAPLLGALFVVLAVIGFLVGGETPDIDALPGEILDEYDSEGKHLAAVYLLALSGVTLLFFAGQLRAGLRLLEPLGRMANAAYAGAITLAIGLLVAAGIHGALTEAVNEGPISGQALQALNALENWSFIPLAAGMGTLVLASAIAIVRAKRMLPAWFGWLGVVIGIVALTPLGFFGFVAGGLWVLALSIMLYTRWTDLHSEGPVAPQATLPA